MQVWLFIVLSSYCCCFCASFNNSPSSLNSSSTHFPLSIPRPLLPYFQSVNKASKRQPRQELTNQLEEVHLSLNIVNKIKTCYDAVEEGNNCISAGRCCQKICFRKLQKMIKISQVDRW